MTAQRHGYSAYANHGCRCDTCCEAGRAWRGNREWRTDPVADSVAVERACAGDKSIALNRAEIVAAFTYLNGRGYSAAEIADRLGVTSRTVQRWQSGEVVRPCSRPATAPRNDVREAA